MDRTNETPEPRTIEYVAPTIVDYGTLAEVTATNLTNDLSDVPFGTPSNHGLS